ncbi:hypothetical protein Poli38472_013826 [Pythium oligandrum]|uniref:Uncharacterized protein n=1 Tax=Pythium oligandrum TaxID=41045 RepID=A0A8K1FBQ3_PYTOL|nr:hypothetical protein Poli38472_013826 [Pythium oligandrum]|eukprot:TMW55064.1 hypothetical protein Poli38472_013826 [Pythium oligandrum]
MAFQQTIEGTRAQIAALDVWGTPRDELKAFAATTFGRCVLGLAGYPEHALTQLQQFVKLSSPSDEQIETMEENLLLLADVVSDEDNANFIARLGMHPLLMRLMEHEHEVIQEATAQVVASCTSSKFSSKGISFPHRARQLGEVKRAFPLILPLPADARDSQDQSVLIRQVPTRMTGQPKTGYLLWGAAIVLARWIHLHRDLFDDKAVLEVGSGLGLGGIVAARYAMRTTLTDYQEDTCQALEYNVALNRQFTHELDASKPDVTVENLDWDSLESINGPAESPKGKVDVIIGCDIICEPSTAEGFLRVVRNRLSAHGVAYLMNADAHSRFGVAYLHDVLSKSELVYSITKVEDLTDGHILLETVHDAKELRYEYYEIRLPPASS